MTGLWLPYLSCWVFMALTTDSPVHESTSHGFIFSTDKSNISRSCEAGHWRFPSSCFSCTPSLCRETLPRAPWIVLNPAQQRCHLWQMGCWEQNHPSDTEFGIWWFLQCQDGWECGCRPGSMPCHGSYRAVVQCEHHGYLGTTFLLVFSTEM